MAFTFKGYCSFTPFFCFEEMIVFIQDMEGINTPGTILQEKFVWQLEVKNLAGLIQKALELGFQNSDINYIPLT